MDLYDILVAKALSGSGGGGGGGSDPVLLATESLGHVATSSTSATNLQSVTLNLKDADAGIDSYGNYDLLVAIASINSAPSAGKHIKTVTFIVTAGDSNAEIHNVSYCITTNFKESADGVAQSRVNNSKYGVYVNTAGTTNTGELKLDLQSKYNVTSTGVIDDDYTLRVYGVDLSGII
jgi:hypothetical protein